MYNKTLISKAVRNAFTDEQVAAFVRLFKVAPASAASSKLVSAQDAIEKGIIFTSKDGTIQEFIPSIAANAAFNLYGNDTKLFNQTFYKSFGTVRDASSFKLLFDQIAHYMTTYGAESLGVKVPTYVPIQALDLPENTFNEKFKMVVIRFLPDEDCFAMLDSYLKNLTAPSENVLEAVKSILMFAKIPTDDIKSFEIQIIKHQMDGTVPSNPVSQLRYMIYLATGGTLVIKNRMLRESIKNSNSRDTLTTFNILAKCDKTRLASIFLRYKPLFLAFKTHKDCAPVINQLRRLADTFHKPLSNVTLQNFTNLRAAEDKAEVIKTASNRDLIKLLNSIYNRMMVTEPTPGVFAIRSGRTFVKEDGVLPASRVLDRDAQTVLNALTARLKPVLNGKTFFYPSYIDYSVPTSEKQFIGNIPYGTCVSADVDGAFTAGIHWFDEKNGRVDIDLHLNSATRHFGWNAGYRDGSDILYTGDQTAAPLPSGAAEAYWFTPTEEEPFILGANLYSGSPDVPFKFFMTDVKPEHGRQSAKYTYDQNASLFPAIPMKFAKESNDMTIGLFIGHNFYFYGGTLSSGIVPSANYEQFIKGLSAQIQSKSNLRTLLTLCGANLITDGAGLADLTPEKLAEVISLTPEDITAETLFDIIDGNI